MTQIENQTQVTALLEVKKPKERKEQPKIDPMALAFMMILEAVQVSHEGTAIHAKEVQANAASQNHVINEEAQINYVQFTKAMEKEVTIKKGNKAAAVGIGAALGALAGDVAGIFGGPGASAAAGDAVGNAFEHNKGVEKWAKDEKKKEFTTAQISIVNTKNEEISAERNVMCDQLNELKQGSQVQMTDVNSNMQEGQQAVSEGSKIAQMLVSLTNQIAQI